ncbi:hypothetical protein BKK79_13710 [Cupriavidus sp. USMAA2-4]|uniref:Lipoprotein n=1 Tax=Cupriavidus malaysiensis TaxID=367825 RepID=A0ABM6F7M2_9BURK|nr:MULTISPECIES: hypothetical protein [Cupriavidus]AOY92712.1 hypothetical protein BKK79_13710 [Cupriavidus sp. USMAA2-4]AOZ00814.1 hypothetical protein BKK81_17330 [Cupriavidus sp. USMAHM13]AOZ07574.1 hypothetical protein BKK80_18340 [Cupriavidus malaysiensis]
MKLAPILLAAGLLATACASRPPVDGQAPQSANESANAHWQALRGDYTDCARRQADAELPRSGTAQALADDALKACRAQLEAVRVAFRDYLDAQMVSSHGRDSARQAANQVGRDTEAKTRAYLVRYIESERSRTAR